MDHIQVERTSKGLKLAQIFVVLWNLGAIGTGLYLQGDRGLWVGGVGLAIGFVLHSIVRLLKWWEHG
jgi:hypothetical protein